MRFGIGIIGATGYVGTPYREEIRQSNDENVRIVALCARRQDRLAAAGTEDGAELTTADWHQVLEHPDVNLVLVLTPDALHYEPVMACAALHKHVLCEKPVGTSAAQARAMWQAVQAASLGHFVPFWTRYVPIFQRARQLVQEGLLGDLRAVIYRWHNPRPVSMPFTWRDDAELSAAGSIADVGSHAYDTLRFILGAEASRVLVHADVITPAKPDLGAIDLSEAIQWGQSNPRVNVAETRRATTPDYAQIAMEFPLGVIGCMMLSHAPVVRKGFAPELELHGTQGSLAIDRLAGELRIADSPEPARLLETVSDDGHDNRFQHYVFPALRARAAGRECADPGMEDGWRVQIFTDAAIASAQRGTWVELDRVDEG